MCSSPSTAHIEDLHEAAELDDRRDEPTEGLADALAQIGALEERGDVAIRFVRPLLELRAALAHPGELRRLRSGPRAPLLSPMQRLERSMHDEIGIAADRRREVRVLRERQAEVTDVRRLIDRLRHRANDQRLDERPVGRVRRRLGDRLQIARRDLLGQIARRFRAKRASR